MNVFATRQCSPPRGLSGRTSTASLLLAVLLLTHVALMTTEQHAVVMDATHALHAGPAATIAIHDGAHRAAESGEHQAPTTILGDCPAQQAILPMLLLALLALFANERSKQATNLRRRVGRTIAQPPPPLAPQHRRAMLQIFLI